MTPFYDTWKKNVSGEMRKCHLLTQIETDNIVLITYKWWSKYKQRWIYEAEPQWLIERFNLIEPKYK